MPVPIEFVQNSSRYARDHKWTTKNCDHAVKNERVKPTVLSQLHATSSFDTYAIELWIYICGLQQ